ALWKRRRGDMTLREVVHLALGATQPASDLAFEGVSAAGAVGDFLDRLNGHRGFEEIPLPRGFGGELRPYQRRGYSWLAFLRRFALGACLADDMGLGKTVQTLALLLRENGSDSRPALLVCPTSVIGNWEKEASRFATDLSLLVHHGIRREKAD